MRKKSHISVAKYLIKSMNVNAFQKHRKAFIIGSILPDCIPSFLTRKHTIEDTFYILRKEIEKLTEEYDITRGVGMYYCRHLGVITHYVADYFTLPHNTIFEGSLKDHIIYEKELKFELRSYIYNGEPELVRDKSTSIQSVDDICAFILHMHKAYIEVAKEVKNDCQFIVELCHYVVDTVTKFIEFQFEKKLQIAFQL